jgi:hypothetical protein
MFVPRIFREVDLHGLKIDPQRCDKMSGEYEYEKPVLANF